MPDSKLVLPTNAEPDPGYRERGFYYGGKWEAPASGNTFVSTSPSTGRQLAEVPLAEAEGVDRAVRAAAKGCGEWRKVSLKERAKCMESFAQRIRDNAKDLALVTRLGFIGSVETGRRVAVGAAEGLKRVSLELGGKYPISIFPDADPKQAAAAAIKGMNMKW